MDSKPVHLVYFNHTDIALLLIPTLSRLFEIITVEVLVGHKDQESPCQLMRANVHTDWDDFGLKRPTGHGLEGLFLTVLFNFNNFELADKCEHDQLIFLIVGHEHGSGGLHCLRLLLASSLLRLFVVIGDMVLHDLSNAHIRSLIEFHVVVFVLIALFKRLLIAIKLDVLDGGQALLFWVFSLLVLQSVQPLRVAIALFLEDSDQKLVVL